MAERHTIISRSKRWQWPYRISWSYNPKLLSKVRENNDPPRSNDTEGRRQISDTLRLGRLSESAKGCRLAKMTVAESAGCGLSIAARKPVATIRSTLSVARVARTPTSGRSDVGVRTTNSKSCGAISGAVTPVVRTPGSRDCENSWRARQSPSRRVRTGWVRVRIGRQESPLAPWKLVREGDAVRAG